jgi:hypothetical protein
MDKKISNIVILLIFLFSINSVNAYFYNITYNCKDDICIEGETAEWLVTVYNRGKHIIEFTAVELLDSVNHSLIAQLKIPYYPLTSERGDVIVVKQNQKVTINLSGKIPMANYQQNLIYYPCFTNTMTDSYIIAKYKKYEERHCYIENETMPVIQCISNEDCDDGEYCNFNKCLKLDCGECQYIKNHQCMDYECCSSKQCGFDEACRNNVCKKLNCSENEFIGNHTCRVLNCGFDEYIVNKTCKKLNCSYDEFVFNHTCKKLNCSYDEFIEDHKCKALNCKENEYAENHTCRELKCLYNETILNHACVPLKCSFFQDIKNHACVNNKSIIFKSIFELIVIIVIITFLILDTREYKAHHKRIEDKK